MFSLQANALISFGIYSTPKESKYVTSLFCTYKAIRNPPLCYLVSFWIVSLTLSINKTESSRDLTILIMSFISSFDIISIALLLLCEAEDEG